jgi:hypothetical protein
VIVHVDHPGLAADLTVFDVLLQGAAPRIECDRAVLATVGAFHLGLKVRDPITQREFVVEWIRE